MLPARRSGRLISPFDPAREFEDIYERMGRLMSAAFGDMGLPGPDGAWSPLAEVSENDDAYLVRAELFAAGVRQAEVARQLGVSTQAARVGPITRFLNGS